MVRGPYMRQDSTMPKKNAAERACRGHRWNKEDQMSQDQMYVDHCLGYDQSSKILFFSFLGALVDS